MKHLIIRRDHEVYEETKRILKLPDYIDMSLRMSTDSLAEIDVTISPTIDQLEHLMALWIRTGAIGSE